MFSELLMEQDSNLGGGIIMLGCPQIVELDIKGSKDVRSRYDLEQAIIEAAPKGCNAYLSGEVFSYQKDFRESAGSGTNWLNTYSVAVQFYNFQGKPEKIMKVVPEMFNGTILPAGTPKLFVDIRPFNKHNNTQILNESLKRIYERIFLNQPDDATAFMRGNHILREMTHLSCTVMKPVQYFKNLEEIA